MAATDVAGSRPDDVDESAVLAKPVDAAGGNEVAKPEELDCGPMTTVRVNENGSVKYEADTWTVTVSEDAVAGTWICSTP